MFRNVFKYYQQHKITQTVNESILRVCECTLCYAHARRKHSEYNCTKTMHTHYFSRILSMLNSDWLQHARGIHGVYEFSVSYYINLNLDFKFQHISMHIKCTLKQSMTHTVGHLHKKSKILRKKDCITDLILRYTYNIYASLHKTAFMNMDPMFT